MRLACSESWRGDARHLRARPRPATLPCAARDNHVVFHRTIRRSAESSASGPPGAGSVAAMNATDAGRTASPAPTPAPQGSPASSFLRRHPVLAGFGVLAALSLFAAYWPASAIVTGVLVAGRATGMDRALFGAARRVASAAARRIRSRGRHDPSPQPPTSPEPAPPQAAPPAPAPSPSSPSPTAPDPSEPARRARRARPPAERTGVEL